MCTYDTFNNTANVGINVNMGVHSRNHCHRGKAISNTYSQCVSVALDIQHAKRMCHILPTVACRYPACKAHVPYIANGGL